MPAWSPLVGSLIIELARRSGLLINQMRLQRLVYIAHGMRLLETGEPLTGDRPEAWHFGPIYRRLADAAAHAGNSPIHNLALSRPYQSELDPLEEDLITFVVRAAGTLPMERLSAITRGEGSPWRAVFADGKGRNRDIGHQLIKHHFERLHQGPIPEAPTD